MKKNKKILKSLLTLQIILLISSCASIISGRNQSVTVTSTTSNNLSIDNSKCKLTNSKGSWYSTTPNSIFIRKSWGDMTIECSNNYLKGSKTFKSKHEAIVWGNIIFGGLIGWAIDAGTGSGFSYPQTMNVEIQ
jgi:hypothetical protein